jgi:hypothetical protein
VKQLSDSNCPLWHIHVQECSIFALYSPMICDIFTRSAPVEIKAVWALGITAIIRAIKVSQREGS